jgi:hydroxymethylpyrimidine pyrophosphatase-like HAD family hydrolase
MIRFEEMLSQLDETIAMVSKRDVADIVRALKEGRDRITVAIGSGDSIATAHYFARCRSTLGLGASLVMTPMEFILGLQDWSDADIWLFSTEADNPDTRAAIRSAADSSHQSLRLMTTCHGEGAIADSERDTILVPVANPKDSYFFARSMVAMVSTLLFASDRLTECPHRAALVDIIRRKAQAAHLSPGPESIGFNVGDTVFLLYDPQLMPVAAMIESYLWQSGIAPVQRFDFREFARIGHIWPVQYPESAFLLALTTCESEFIWDSIRAAMPSDSRNQTINCGDGGRFANASGMLAGLKVVSQMLNVADSVTSSYTTISSDAALRDAPILEELVKGLTPAVKHKAIARQLHDPIFDLSESLRVLGKRKLQALENARFVGLALDYDGTVVPNEPAEARFGPPPQDVMEQLVRLVENGIQVGVATGRGGSAGAKLREALPDRIHSRILMGYFNGAHIRTLDVDISADPPRSHVRVASVSEWIASSHLLRPDAHIYSSHLQVTVTLDQILDPENFAERLAACPAVTAGDMRILRSQHTFDIIPAKTTKLAVMHGLAQRSGRPDGSILGIGDSGSPLGNDRELLSSPHAISVDRVCGSYEGTWSLFGTRVRGPEALVWILRAMRTENGFASIDLGALNLD